MKEDSIFWKTVVRGETDKSCTILGAVLGDWTFELRRREGLEEAVKRCLRMQSRTSFG